MSRKLLIVLLVVCGLLIGGCDSGPKISSLNSSSVVLAFGDSLTHGTGAAEGQAYPDVLSDLLGKHVINVGIPGETTSRGVKRLPGVLDQYNPTLVILCEGGNDFLRRHNEETTISNLRKMIETIQTRGSDIILIGVPKLGFGLAVPPFYEALAEEYGIPYEGEILVDLLGDRSMKSDEIHPNATGYRLMAEAIHEVIEEARE